MKKVLFATTALVGTAGVAAADVAVTGFAEMGIMGGTGMSVQFHTDIDVTFTLSGETDGGVTFGAAIDIDESTNGITTTNAAGGATGVGNGAFGNDADDGGIAVFVSSNFGTLTMGDTDGALDWAMTEVAIGGSLRDDHTGHAGYNGNAGLDGSNDGQVARYDYSFGDFSFAVSAELDDNGAAAGNGVATSGGGIGGVAYGVGAKYSFTMTAATIGFGVGYQTGTGRSIYGASIDANFDNGFRAILNYSSLTGAAVTNTTHYGIGIGYTWDALTLAANYGNFNRTGAADSNGFGVIANYALGGGATLQAGYGSSSTTGAASTNTYSFGIAMSF